MKIEYFKDKCPSPLECGLCLRACPTMVFNALPAKMEKFKETGPQDYIIEATYHPSCTGCMLCVEVCPQGALAVYV